MARALTPDLVPAARRLAHRFLRTQAPTMWAEIMAGDAAFRVPDEIAHLDPAAQARWLAHQEARRLAQARLFYLEEPATDTAVTAANGLQSRPFLLGRSMPPAEYGLMVWIRDGSATARGADIIACHWQVRDDGVQVGWWIDFAGNTRTKMTAAGYDQAEADAVIEEYGLLSHHREALLPYGAFTVDGSADPLMTDRVYALAQTTVTSWVILSDNQTTTRLAPAPLGPIAGLEPLPGADDSVTVALRAPDVEAAATSHPR